MAMEGPGEPELPAEADAKGRFKHATAALTDSRVGEENQVFLSALEPFRGLIPQISHRSKLKMVLTTNDVVPMERARLPRPSDGLGA